MSFYQGIKSAKAAAIGTIMPWTGNISSIPDGWIICDGSSIPARDYPLLARAMQDTYNASTTSTFIGTFPDYSGNIVLPALLNRPVCDIETSYFGPSSPTGNPIDQDSTATAQITPFIGPNTDNGINTTFNDVATDVIFSLNERVTTPGGLPYYTGKLSGNTIIEGSGEGVKVMFFGPRKLGRGHIKSHRHGGRNIPTILVNPSTEPGEGVIPWSNVRYNFRLDVSDNRPGPTGDTFNLRYELFDEERGRSGWGAGTPGRTVGGVVAENPPVNWTPQSCVWNPIKDEITEPSNVRTFNSGVGGSATFNALSGGITGFNRGDANARTVKYGLSGAELPVPSGYTDFYPDVLDNFPASSLDIYGTLNSNPGWDFLLTTQSAGRTDVIRPHTHDEFDVTFDRAGLRPNTSIEVDVYAPASNLNLDNTRNLGVLQINFNTSQPGVTSLYLIRAY
ncbi:short tail fiber [Synechococcus phage S-PM2]|uniref:Short tail fiber n=1 Tax=Synechococcus phage S-PM2 TaxID=238854 RepID=Q5GQB8_BPSYP|nr:short tail fiber protein [Synechococcus phage S-PM2]CAF34284.1 short tail fiber [Synechococcus phage S-PM2]CFW42454.1 short tail fiber [Synechococcus phage S-PM2]